MRIYLPLPVDWDEDDELTGLPDLGEDGYLAQLLALGMLLYCKRRLSDGRVPLAQPARIMHRLPTERVGQLVKHLLDSCFITEQAGAWQVCNYTANYGSRADAERRSEQRRSAGALGGRARAKRRGHGPALAGAQANAKHLLERGQASLARAESETESDKEPHPQAPAPGDEAAAHNGARGGGGANPDLVTQVQGLMGPLGYPVSPEDAERITRRLLDGRDDIAHPAQWLRKVIATPEQAAALLAGSAAPLPPQPPPLPPNPKLDRQIADAFEDVLGGAISAGQAAKAPIRRATTDPELPIIETAADPRALLQHRRTAPGRGVADGSARTGKPPATDEQRAKRAAEIREALAAAAPRGAVLESGSGQHEPEPEHQDQLALGEPADAEPPY